METQYSSTYKAGTVQFDIQSWKDHMLGGTHSFPLSRISILLLRARFRFFEG